MQFSTLEIQLFFTVIVILACVYLALLCDFLRGSNQRLREQNVALKTRLETQGQITVDAKALMKVLQSSARPALETSEGKTPGMAKPAAEVAQAAAAGARSGRWRGEVRPAPDRRSRNELESIVAAVARRGPNAFSAPEANGEPAAPARPLEVVRKPAPAEKAAAAVASTGNVLRMWTVPEPGSASESRLPIPPPAPPLPEIAAPVTAEIVPAGAGPLPPGMHSPWTLAAALDRHEHVSGLVVVIGINEFDKLQESLGAVADEMMRKLDQHVRSLIGPRDFACHPAADQYLLVFPQDSGAAAQRRLSQLSERLWDFQLRSLEASTLVLSWGAVEVQAELLAEAVSEATERMRKTQRTRRRIPMEWSRRPAVSA